jgi:predicted nucleotidyltransferase component of viral defense system
MVIAEKEIVLTYLLQLLAERGILERLAFKGGTCIRKMIMGSQGRFSTDLDFTGLEQHDHEDIILEMMEAFQRPFHGLTFAIPDDGYYETLDGLSWGVSPTYAHEWNPSGQSDIKVQVSRRETPTLSVERRTQVTQSYFAALPFIPIEIACMALSEILAEKIRACYQRSKARDIYDLSLFATRPLDQTLVRCLVVLKLWQSNDIFNAATLMAKFENGRQFDWEDLRQLIRRTIVLDPERMLVECHRGYAFLAELTADEERLAKDRAHKLPDLHARLSGTCAQIFSSTA